MKKFLILLSILFCGLVYADTITLNWLNDDKTVSSTTSCTIGGDVILPTPPTKYGYTFQGWGANYIPIEYIESTGTQWIDTGYVPNLSTRFFIDFLTYNENCHCEDHGTIFGGTWKTYIISTWLTKSGGYFGVGQNAWDPKITKNVRGQVSFIGNVFTAFDGTQTTINSLPSFTETATNLCVFSSATGKGPRFKGRMYSLRFYDNNTTVRDFIPVLDPDGIACMYDKVEGKFYYNQGTGSFIAGPVLTE